VYQAHLAELTGISSEANISHTFTQLHITADANNTRRVIWCVKVKVTEQLF